MNYFDIAAEYQSLFGIRAAKFENIPQAANRSQTGSNYWRQDTAGRWHWMPVKLSDLDLWAPVMRLTARTTVVETAMVEIGGTVKEIISLDDWHISIRGIIKRPDGSYPDTEQQQLKRLRATGYADKAVKKGEERYSMPIESVKTSIFLTGNENVVMTNLQIIDPPGQMQSVGYEIELISDKPFELELDK